MQNVALRLRKGKTVSLDDAPILARFVTDWAMDKASLPDVLKFVRASTLDYEHLASAVLQYGGLIQNRDGNDLGAFELKNGLAAMRMFSALLENQRTRSGAVDCFWVDRPKAEPEWVYQLMKGLSEEANLRLLIEKHSPTPISSPDVETRALIANAVPRTQRIGILKLASKRRKLPELYKAIPLEECLYLSTEAQRAQILEADLGL